MKDWRFQDYQSGVLLMSEYYDGDNHFRYLVIYPNMNTSNDTYYTDWDFRREELNSHSSCEWELDDKEKDEIKNHIRTVIKPKDYCEFEFRQHYDDGFIVKTIYGEKKDDYTDYVVFFPTKEDRNEWGFAIHTSDNGNFIVENWNISDLDAEYLKNKIRTEIKPKNLYESEEKEMNYVNIGLMIPEEKYELLKGLAEQLDCREDKDAYDRLAEAINKRDEYADRIQKAKKEFEELEKNLNPNAMQELEVCKHDKEIIINEWNKSKQECARTIDEAKDFMYHLLDFININYSECIVDTMKLIFKDVDESFINKFELEHYIPKEKTYDVVTVEVTQTRTKEIKVVVPHETYIENDIDKYIENECSDGINDLFSDVDDFEYDFSQHSNYDSNLTKKQLDNQYHLCDMFPGTSEIEEEVF